MKRDTNRFFSSCAMKRKQTQTAAITENCKRSGEKPLKAMSETTKTRFANLSSEDLSKLIADKDSANTKKATDHAVRVFRAYLREKRNPGGFRELFPTKARHCSRQVLRRVQVSNWRTLQENVVIKHKAWPQ